MARQSTMARFEVSGEILSEDTLALLAQPACKLAGAEMDEGDFKAAWELLSDQWQAVRQQVSEFDNETLRTRWIKHVLSLLDYQIEYLPSHPTYAERRTIPINYRARELPFWLLGWRQKPDDKPETGARRVSPHEHFQEYLDLTDDDWGIICNGKVIRLLHDYHKTLTRNFVEADLESIFEALDVDAFRAVWRVFHASRYRGDSKGVLPIEKLRDYSRQEGSEIGKELRKQVLAAITTLGNGFISADRSGNLSAALLADPEGPSLFYQSLLRFVYRLLFLLYIENKPHWTPASDPVWASSYSITRLREKSEELRTLRANSEDYWEGLRVVFGIIRDGCERFMIHPYGGELFNDARLWEPLREAGLQNGDLLTALRLLTMFERNKQTYRVNFRNLRIEAIGSVYEALLDVAPVVTPDGRFSFAEGTDRKLTGSYYTPPELVAELIKSALVPVIEDRLKGVEGKEAREKALLSITVVDTACGSGSILIQALDKLTEKLCEIRKEGEEPSELDIREARRDVVTHCIHGVDLNPMAVELCKFTLWLHVAHPNFPLSFLEPVIKCGNALIGAPLKSQVAAAKKKIEDQRMALAAEYDGQLQRMPKKVLKEYQELRYVGWPDAVPTEAFTPVTGDDKIVAKRVQESNKFDLKHIEQTTIDEMLMIGRLADTFRMIQDMREDSIDDVKGKAEAYRRFVEDTAYNAAKIAADTWCAAFYWPLDIYREIAPTTSRYKVIERNPLAGDKEVLATVREIATRQRFFHWEIEFPAVFIMGGFDCILGNPPWERIKLQEQEFFATRAPDIAQAANKAARERMIQSLAATHPDLMKAFIDAKHDADSEGKYLRDSGRCPLTAVGDINTYSVFSEIDRSLLRTTGRAGIIVPTGIATDDTTKKFFSNLMETHSLAGLVDYENREGLFPSVDSRMKFCALTMAGESVVQASFAFFLTNVAQGADSRRRFELSSDDIARLNPNTRTCPVFRTKADAKFTEAIYTRIPIFEADCQSSWDVRFMAMFHMANDSNLFLDEQVESALPLYEAKMLHQFDHRWATYADRSTRDCSIVEKANPNFQVTPRYWLHEHEVLTRLAQHSDLVGQTDDLTQDERIQLLRDKAPKWLFGFRDIVRNNDLRTAIFAFLPLSAVGARFNLVFLDAPAPIVACFGANLNSLVLDYVAREKIAGINLAIHHLKQFPVLPAKAYEGHEQAFIVPRVLELVYSTWEMKPFAQDLGFDGPPFAWDEDRRALLRAELDAYYARLYGLTRKQLRYILDPHGLSDAELENILDPWEDPTCSGPHLLPDNPTTTFPGETFRVLKNNDTAKYGDYRTRRLVLEAWARLEAELGPAQVVNYREMVDGRSDIASGRTEGGASHA